VDNTTFWGGSLLGDYFPVNENNPNAANPELFISQVLK
jgi:hypothetical protein